MAGSGLCQAAAWSSADLVVTGIAGCAGLLAAIEAGKDLALANKETLIAADRWCSQPEQRQPPAAGSEHSASSSACKEPLADNPRPRCADPGLRRIQLTASGGARRLGCR